MTIEDIRAFCLKLRGGTEDIKWGHDLCFSVGDKMFCVTGLDEQPVGVSLKVSDEEFDELSALPNFKPAPYMARNKWVLIEDASKVKDKELKRLIEQSYALVKAKLPKKLQQQIG